MSIRHHLDEATLLSYTAGSMTNAMALVVACHLSMCPQCRAKAAEMEHVGAALLTSLPPKPVSGDALEAVLAALDDEIPMEDPDPADAGVMSSAPDASTKGSLAKDSEVPMPLMELIGGPLESVQWKRLAPGIGYIDIPMQGTGVSKLLRLEPGKSVLPHTHQGNELTIVLRGSFSDEVGRFAAGDIADLDEEIDHQPLVDSEQECICLIATDAPLKFNSLLGRIVQPLTGF